MGVTAVQIVFVVSWGDERGTAVGYIANYTKRKTVRTKALLNSVLDAFRAVYIVVPQTRSEARLLDAIVLTKRFCGHFLRNNYKQTRCRQCIQTGSNHNYNHVIVK